VNSSPAADCILKETHPQHPFSKANSKNKRSRKGRKKNVSFSDRHSPESLDNLSSVSTVTGTESVRHPHSGSDGDSDVETYRIKSILRGKPPVVYVKGEALQKSTEPITSNEPEEKDEKTLETLDSIQSITQNSVNMMDEGESPVKKLKSEESATEQGVDTTNADMISKEPDEEISELPEESTKIDDEGMSLCPSNENISSEKEKEKEMSDGKYVC